MSTENLKRNSERRAFHLCVLGIIFITVIYCALMWGLYREHTAEHAMSKNYIERLRLVPRDAVMIAGAQTVAVNYWRGIGAGEWEAIGTGAGWPGAGQLAPLIEKRLREKRSVFLDADARLWQPCGWKAAELREVVALESRFRFKRISDTIYRIELMNDGTAQAEAPQLESLLPENRTEEVSKCLGRSE